MKPDPKNPNRMDIDDKARMKESLAEFGDLSGIVINRRTDTLVGGHQRVDVLADGKLTVKDLKEAEQDGTVARGWLEVSGKKYAVRVVDWDETKAHAALLAANRFGRVGYDDDEALMSLINELKVAEYDLDLTGFDAEALNRMQLESRATKILTPEQIRQLENAGDTTNSGEKDFESEMSKKTPGVIPIIPKYDEHYQAFIIICETRIDEAWMRKKLNLETPKQSYKDSKIRQCNVITLKQFKELLCVQS